MTANQFRKLALSLPEVSEGEHMKHPDFRVQGKIFATLWPDGHWGMVKLNVEEQGDFCAGEPSVYEPVPGGWGRSGATKVYLQKARVSSAKKALISAWRNTAPKGLSSRFNL